jgi:hypothetical protein
MFLTCTTELRAMLGFRALLKLEVTTRNMFDLL